MRAVVVLLLLFALPSAFCASLQPVTVVMELVNPYSDNSFKTLDRELNKIMAGARMSTHLELERGLPAGIEAPALVVFKMDGFCTMDPPGSVQAKKGDTLAFTHVSDGRPLPFGEVDCDRVRTSLERTVGRNNPQEHQLDYGVALARVIAHEMYHMLSQSEKHTQRGLTKESLSSRELLQSGFAFTSDAEAAIEKSAVAVRP